MWLKSKRSGLVTCNDMEIKKVVKSCEKCQEVRTPRELFIPAEFPERCWWKLSVDFLHWKEEYIVIGDYYSRCAVCKQTKDTKVDTFIHVAANWIWVVRIPLAIRTDNGAQFLSTSFKIFVHWGMEHVTNRPMYPQSNEEVERIAQTVKALLSTNLNLQVV